jgi:ubiquinone/menaquinone biosynthesis C-methylase UbiE
MTASDPKAVAQQRFSSPDWNDKGLDLVGRCATDPPLVVQGLLDAIDERAQAGSRVIELGFGGGWLLEELVSQGNQRNLLGLDLSAGFARRAHEAYSDHVSILIGDMDRLPFESATFDVIATCWTLYFMRDIDATLTETKRCLKPAGRLVAATNAPDHEAECGDLVAEAIRVALGRDEPEHDIATRFDLESGAAFVHRHFPRIEVRRWHGEMVLKDRDDIQHLWPKWEPAMLPRHEQLAVRDVFLRLAGKRFERDGELRIRRRNGAFICDLDS